MNMKLKRTIIGALVVAFTHCLTVSESWAGNVLFTNAKVGIVETRSAAWGAWLIITVYDSSGNGIMRLCDTASAKQVLSLPLSDPAAKSVMAIALTAKAFW